MFCVIDEKYREHSGPLLITSGTLSAILLCALYKPMWISRKSASRAYLAIVAVAISYYAYTIYTGDAQTMVCNEMKE